DDLGQAFYSISPPVTVGGQRQSPLARGTTACAANPNDPCCFNCNVGTVPDGCTAPADDPNCQKGALAQSEHPENLRRFHQKQRYGIDFLYPVQRYVDGLTKPVIQASGGKSVKNPLFDDLQCKGTNCLPPRDPTLVFMAGVIGVPWQDIARDPHD